LKRLKEINEESKQKKNLSNNEYDKRMYDLDEKRKYFNDIKNEYTFDLQYQVNIYFI
jgi:hypothetical protein